jgi:hypothetical protein
MISVINGMEKQVVMESEAFQGALQEMIQIRLQNSKD